MARDETKTFLRFVIMITILLLFPRPENEEL